MVWNKLCFLCWDKKKTKQDGEMTANPSLSSVKKSLGFFPAAWCGPEPFGLYLRSNSLNQCFSLQTSASRSPDVFGGNGKGVLEFVSSILGAGPCSGWGLCGFQPGRGGPSCIAAEGRCSTVFSSPAQMLRKEMAATMRRGYKELLKEAVDKLKDRLAAGWIACSHWKSLHEFILMLTLCVQVDVDVLRPETTGKYWKVCKATDFFFNNMVAGCKKTLQLLLDGCAVGRDLR